MIKAVRCDQPSFKEIKFKKGFNVVLAERIKDSTAKDSRNGLGKTTLIEIIHFCLGARTKPNEGVRVKELENWTFILDLILRGNDYTIYRNTNDFSKVRIEGDFSDWHKKPEYDNKKKSYFMKINDWNLLLGYLMFDLPIEITDRNYTPTFRSLISYFIRHGAGAFLDPFKHHSQQKEFDIQVNNAYLLGLNWDYATEFQIIKDKTKTLNELKKAASQGLLTGFVGSPGELEAERIGLNEKIKRSQQQLKNFKVHPQYHEIQNEANELTKQTHKIVNKCNLNQQILNKYEESLIEEKDVSVDRVEQIYRDAGLVFPDNLKRRLGEVIDFHKKIIKNRKTYLQSEIVKISREIEEQKSQIESLDNKRAELLNILEMHGALEEYTELQNRATTLKQQLEEVKNRIENLRKFEEGKSVLEIEKQELLQKARRDFDERKRYIETAIKLFNKNSERLYSEPGILSLDITDVGYKFKVDIKRAGSQGVEYMKVFCYDLMLVQLRPKYQYVPGFLIHDSTIFDGVDERQIARAIELAAEESEREEFQYICAINSDHIPYQDFKEEFKAKFNDFVRIKFTDKTEDGGLLGFRY